MYSKLIKFIKKHVDNNTADLLIFNSVVGIALLGMVVLITIEAVMKYEKTGLLMIIGVFIYLLSMNILANYFPDKIMLWSSLILYPLNLLIFPFLFIKGEGGGIASAMPMWFLLGVLMTIIMLKGKNCVCLILLSCASFIFSMLFVYRFPEATNYIDNEFYYYEDNMVCFLVITLSVGVIMKYLTFVQNAQKKALEENAKNIRVERNNAIKANRAKTTFLTNISHDIRTPLTDILAMTSIGKANLEDKEKVRECFDEIIDYSMQLLYLFDNTLDLAEIESDSLRIKENRFFVPEMISLIESAADKSAKMNRITFVCHCDEKIDKFLVGDAAKIRQIINLILDNSFKFTNAGGEVRLEIKKQEDLVDNQIWYRFIIKDTGLGMTEDFIEESLFEPYVRGTDDLVRNSSGSGIGMSLVKSLIEAMNGKIRVKSKKGVGTTVTVDIPLQRDNLSETSMSDELLFNVKNVKVLIVDDDEISMEITSQLIEETGASAVKCNQAEAAIDILVNSKPNEYQMAIIDIMLPGIDGYSAARNIRSLDREDLAKLPLIALTANAYSLAEEKTILSGMNEHISKPVDVTEFYQKIYRYLVKYSV